MTIQLGWAGIGVILAILGHAAFTVWWASKITNQIAHVGDGLNRLDKELEKRDAKIAAAWTKLDGLQERVIKIEAKI